MTRHMMLIAALLASVCFTTSSAQAQAVTPGPPVMPYDPAQQVFDRAVDLLKATVNRCHYNHRETTAEAVTVIEFLVNAGHDDLAEIAARYFVDEIKDISEACADYATTSCRRAIEKLRMLGATELARDLKELCLRALAAIDQSEENSIRRIRAALP